MTLDQKELIERAARVQGRSLSDFVITALSQAAKQAIEEHTVWKLTREQSDSFVSALANPPAPNRRLREAYKKFRKHRGALVR